MRVHHLDARARAASTALDLAGDRQRRTLAPAVRSPRGSGSAGAAITTRNSWSISALRKPGLKPSISASYGASPSACDSTCALSRVSATTSSRCGAKSAKLFSCCASSQRTSASDVARARRVTSDERRRDRVVALAAHLAQVGELPVLELRLVGLRALDQPRHLRRRQQRVAFGLERGQLLAAHVGAAARHHHGRIPAQQARRAAEGVQAAEFLLELLVGSLCHGRSRTFRRSRAAAAEAAQCAAKLPRGRARIVASRRAGRGRTRQRRRFLLIIQQVAFRPPDGRRCNFRRSCSSRCATSSGDPVLRATSA